jgi:hypothetical protein
LGKYLKFKHERRLPKTSTWMVQATEDENGFLLGIIKWHGPWRKYCFFPEGNTLFCPDCLNEVINFINEQMQLHKKRKKILIPTGGIKRT